MFRITILLITFNLFSLAILHSYAQDIPRLCIYFENDTQCISVDFSKDSTFTSFSIVKEGFETKAKREKVRKEWQEKGFFRIPIPPQFHYNFFSTQKAEKITSIKKMEDCVY